VESATTMQQEETPGSKLVSAIARALQDEREWSIKIKFVPREGLVQNFSKCKAFVAYATLKRTLRPY